eukprot:evm.model.scf_666.6 EVM.evm.TU.scf_666.6   scf_666:27309-29630(-)
MDSQSEHKKKKKKRKLGSEENSADVGGHAGRKEKKKKSKKHNKEKDQSEGEGHTGGGPSTDNDGGDTCAAPPPSKYVPGGDFERLSSSFLDASELNDDTEVWLLQVPYQLMPLRHLADYEWHMEKLREIEPDRIAILRDAEGADQFSVLAYDNGEESDAVVLNAEDGGTVRTLPVTMCGRIIPQLLVANEETKDTDQQQNQRNPDDGGSQHYTIVGVSFYACHWPHCHDCR